MCVFEMYRKMYLDMFVEKLISLSDILYFKVDKSEKTWLTFVVNIGMSPGWI